MPPKEEGTGLFSKVVKFVRNPTTSWGDLDQEESRESAYSKQMLKEMIERKRRNDFVRKREFDMLRKMRQSEVMAGQDPGGRPSFFQSSMPSRPDDRASTLKKIDEIEAQMSMQWWKTKHADAGRNGSSTNFPHSAHVPPEAARPGAAGDAAAGSSTAYNRTQAQALRAAAGAERQSEPTELPMLDFDTSESPMFVPDPGAPPVPRATTVGPAVAPSPAAPASGTSSPTRAPGALPRAAAVAAPRPDPEPLGGNSGFSASKVFAIHVDEFAHDPELEEAAIRFANGDDAGAEAGLMEVLSPGGARLDHDETWLTLFDLYRATGQQDRFENAAIDFAGRFGRSAPQWVSLPDAVGRMGAALPPAVPGAGTAIADWTCPSTLGTQTLAAMAAALGRATPPWRVTWAKLANIEDAALEGLTKVFTQWASQTVPLRFLAADNLEKVLKNGTPSGDRSVNPARWKLRMEVLRVMHRPDEFELVALDYCVTYEVSPPSWESARCEYKALQADGSAAGTGHTIIGEAFRDSVTSALTTSYGDTQPPGASSQLSHVATVELAGQILGDATEAIQLLDNKLSGADVMVISCARLIRIDFTAAGTLLNWVSAQQAEGRQVQFAEVNRLIAAFFNVIGISEHARVAARKD